MFAIAQASALSTQPKAYKYKAFISYKRDPDLKIAEALQSALHHIEMIVNPILLVEVLSTSTEKDDREGKFLAYQSIASFQEYLLIEQERYHVTQYVKQDEGAWLRRDFIGIEAEVKLLSVACTLSLAEIYREVEMLASQSLSPSVEA